MPFLEESEWAMIAPHVSNMIERIKQYRQQNGVDLKTALKEAPLAATKMFEVITGYADIPPNAIYHHRLKDWGAECPQCGNLLRTPQACACVYCGYKYTQ